MPTHAYTLSEFELGDTEHADDLLLPRAGVTFSKKDCRGLSNSTRRLDT
jgi:hypothetical protein